MTHPSSRLVSRGRGPTRLGRKVLCLPSCAASEGRQGENPMTRLFGRARVPMVLVVVVTVAAFTGSRLRGVFGLGMSVPNRGTADLIIEFKPKRVVCEVYGPAGRAAAALGTASKRCRRPARYSSVAKGV
jgi:hypothetical protein